MRVARHIDKVVVFKY